MATATRGVGQVVNAVTKKRVLREDNIVRISVTNIGSTVGGSTGANIAATAYDTVDLAATIYAGNALKNPVCFVAGTAILTGLGAKAIEKIEAGDLVWAENPETGEKALKRVVNAFKRESDELVHIFVNGEEIITTPEHPFYVPNNGWTGAIKLRAGDILVRQNGDYAIVQKVQHEILEQPVAVYNFEVEDFHTYYVGESSVLVHNANCGKIGKQNGNAPRSNSAQNEQFKYLSRKYKLTNSQQRRLHDRISKHGYGIDEIEDEIYVLFPEKFEG